MFIWIIFSISPRKSSPELCPLSCMLIMDVVGCLFNKQKTNPICRIAPVSPISASLSIFELIYMGLGDAHKNFISMTLKNEFHSNPVFAVSPPPSLSPCQWSPYPFPCPSPLPSKIQISFTLPLQCQGAGGREGQCATRQTKQHRLVVVSVVHKLHVATVAD